MWYMLKIKRCPFSESASPLAVQTKLLFMDQAKKSFVAQVIFATAPPAGETAH